jgi:hypothetical protein
MDSDRACLRLRGLEFACTHAEIVEFFVGYPVLDMVITRSEGGTIGVLCSVTLLWVYMRRGWRP